MRSTDALQRWWLTLTRWGEGLLPSVAVNATVTPPAETPTGASHFRELTRREQWRLMTTVFAFYGNTCHFAYRPMKQLCGITRKPWERFCTLLVNAEVLDRDEASRTKWIGPWNYKRLRRYLKFDMLPLPYPNDYDPPHLAIVERDGDTVDTVCPGAQRQHRLQH